MTLQMAALPFVQAPGIRPSHNGITSERTAGQSDFIICRRPWKYLNICLRMRRGAPSILAFLDLTCLCTLIGCLIWGGEPCFWDDILKMKRGLRHTIVPGKKTSDKQMNQNRNKNSKRFNLRCVLGADSLQRVPDNRAVCLIYAFSHLLNVKPLFFGGARIITGGE